MTSKKSKEGTKQQHASLSDQKEEPSQKESNASKSETATETTPQTVPFQPSSPVLPSPPTVLPPLESAPETAPPESAILQPKHHHDQEKAKGQDEEEEEEEENEEDEEERDEENEEEKPLKLYKSPRLKGYLTILLASIINYNAAKLAAKPIATTSVPASETQQRYAQTVALWSAITTGILIVAHLDTYSPLQKFYNIGLAPKSYWELGIIISLLVWWSVATIVQTSVRGIAGDGKEQYNLYYSTWLCLWTMIWTLERKLCDFGWSTIRGFVTSWPYRAPGWIAINVSCFFTLFWYLDLYLNTSKYTSRIPPTLQPFYMQIPKSQYQWLLFVAAFTLLPSAVFVFLEIFRESNNQVKGNLENILEGCFLVLLSLGWIPSVIVATTPGGFASLVGNAYFFTWATTVFVMETLLWFIHDYRQAVHTALLQKEREYKRHQQQVLQKSRQILQEHNAIPIPPPSSTAQQQQQQQQQQHAHQPHLFYPPTTTTTTATTTTTTTTFPAPHKNAFNDAIGLLYMIVLILIFGYGRKMKISCFLFGRWSF